MHGEAKESAEIGEEKEIVEHSTVQTMGKDKFGIITQSGLQDALDINAGEEKAKALPDGENFVIQFIESNRYYKVDGNGKIEGPIKVVVDKNPGDITVGINGEELKGTEASPYEIWCIEDLVAFSENQNTSGAYINSVVKLGTTLDFNSILSYADYTTTKYDTYLGGDGTTELMTQLSQEGKGFIPIGNSADKSFKGIFDGQGFEIQNIYIKISEDAGLFANVSGEQAKIQNIGISGNIISINSIAGGIAAGGGGEFINCYNKAKVIAENTTLDAVNGTGSAGGIIGKKQGRSLLNIKNCYNMGEIEGGTYSGGILGYEYTGNINIINCYNAGKISGKETAGGIMGDTCSGTVGISNCYNIGNITSNNNAGGILRT